MSTTTGAQGIYVGVPPRGAVDGAVRDRAAADRGAFLLGGFEDGGRRPLRAPAPDPERLARELLAFAATAPDPTPIVEAVRVLLALTREGARVE